jgi:hypothetical protein
VREHEDHVALYYALRRNGDGQFNPATGKNDGISSVYRIRLSSAYVVDPDKPMDIPILAGDLYRKKVFETIKANTTRGAEPRVPQPVPPGTGERPRSRCRKSATLCPPRWRRRKSPEPNRLHPVKITG